MEWMDDGLLLSARPHGETAALVTLLTATHGRHAGLVQGGQGRKRWAMLQPGTQVKARWRARLLDQLGCYDLETVSPFASAWLDDPVVLAMIASACAVTEAALPERQPMAGIYAGLLSLFSMENKELWPPVYVKWEMEVLQSLGYGMDVSCCALSGAREGLAYVSPRTGRAVTAEAAAPYRDKLLPLPGFLCGASAWGEADIRDGLELTGHFLSRHVFAHPQNRRLVPLDGMLPLARQRLFRFFGADRPD